MSYRPKPTTVPISGVNYGQLCSLLGVLDVIGGHYESLRNGARVEVSLQRDISM